MLCHAFFQLHNDEKKRFVDSLKKPLCFASTRENQCKGNCLRTET